MKKNNEPIVVRGEIWYADLSPIVGSEQGGLRPVLIIQNDVGNKHAPTTIAAPITSRLFKSLLPTHIPLAKGEGNLASNSLILLEQIRVIDKQRLKNRFGVLSEDKMEQVNKAIKVSLGV